MESTVKSAALVRMKLIAIPCLEIVFASQDGEVKDVTNVRNSPMAHKYSN